MSYSTEKPWDPITLEIRPAGESSGQLYQDDENTTAFLNGESTTTLFHCSESPGKNIVFKIEPSNQKFGPSQWIAKFHLTSKPRSEKATANWSWDSEANILTVKIPGGGVKRTLRD